MEKSRLDLLNAESVNIDSLPFGIRLVLEEFYLEHLQEILSSSALTDYEKSNIGSVV